MLVLSTDRKPKNNFYNRFYTENSSFKLLDSFGASVLYRAANLPIEKVCLIRYFEETNFSDFKRLVKTLKIRPQKYSWPQKNCKPLNNIFPGSNWSVIEMRVEQSEARGKVLFTKFWMFLTRRKTVTNL